MSAFLHEHQAAISLIVLAFTFALFVLERFPPAVIAIGSAAMYLLLGYIDTRDALAVLSNSAPFTIAAMFILSGALVRTGALDAFASWIVAKSSTHPKATTASFFASASAISAFINNTPLVAVLIPITSRLARALKVSPTQLLIPLSYAAILGGTCTLIGTSTNLLVDGVGRAAGLPAFSLFEITPVGLVTAATGFITMLLLGPLLLPSRKSASEIADNDDRTFFLTELQVAQGASISGSTVAAARSLRSHDIQVVSVTRCGVLVTGDISHHVIAAGDTLSLLSTMSEVLTLHAESDFLADAHGIEEGDSRMIVEAVLAPSVSGTPGRYVSELGLDRFNVRLIAMTRHRRIPTQWLQSIRLLPADRLLLEGTPDGLAAAAEANDFVNIITPRVRSFRRRKAPIAIAALAGVVTLAAFNVMPIEGLAILAVAAILLLRCIDADEAWQSIDGGVLVLIFAMLAIGTALEKTGAIHLIVKHMQPFLDGNSPLLTLFAIYFLSVVLTEIITNNAVAVVLTPIAIGVARELGIDPRPLVVAVMFGASACFATPIGYQTNTMVYGAGNFKFNDFLRIGIPMNLIVGIATCFAIYIFMPFR